MNLRQRGALIVEYVIILPILLFLVWLAVYFGMTFHDYNTIAEVARETARYGAVGNKDENIKTAAFERCNELLTKLYVVSADNIRVTRGADSNLNNEKYLEVNIVAQKVSANSMLLIDEFLPDTLTGKMRMRVELEPAE